MCQKKNIIKYKWANRHAGNRAVRSNQETGGWSIAQGKSGGGDIVGGARRSRSPLALSIIRTN